MVSRLFFVRYCAFTALSSVNFQRGLLIVFLVDSGLSSVAIGWVQSVAFLANMLAEIPTGLFADHMGRKRVLALGLLLLALNGIGYALFRGPMAFLVLSSIGGIGRACQSGGADALLYDHLERSGRRADYTRLYSLSRAIGTFALCLSIGLGGLLAALGWAWLFLCYAACMVAAIPFVAGMAEPAQEDDNGAPSKPSVVRDFIAFMSSLSGRNILLLIFAASLFDVVTSLYLFYAPSLFVSAGLSKQSTAFAMSGYELIASFFYLVATRLLRLATPKILMTSVLVVGAAIVAITASGKLIESIAGLTLLMTLPDIYDVAFSSYTQDLLPSKVRAAALSCYSFIRSILLMIAFPLFGAFSNGRPIWTALACLSLVMVLAITVQLTSFWQRSQLPLPG